MRLCAAFCAAAPGVAPSPELEEALRRAVEAGQTAWPSLQLDALTFVRHLGEHAAGEDAVRELASKHAKDLWLACACARGDRAAIDAFAATYLAHTASLLTKVKAEA